MQEGTKDEWYCYKCQKTFETPVKHKNSLLPRCQCGSSMIQQRVKKVLRDTKGVLLDGQDCPVC